MNKRIKKSAVVIGAVLLASNVFAAEKTAEQLVASKQYADITYRQLMEVMGTASAMINEGLVRENPQLVKKGVDLIIDHPAPNHKPWLIVAPAEQSEFKQTLVVYDAILHSQAEQTALEAEKGEWYAANKAASALMNTCIACHAAWKGKALDIRKTP
jgi:hypothetical protein